MAERSEHVRTEEEIDESRRVLETLIQNLPGMFYRWRNDRALSPIYLSDGTTRLTGYTPEQLMQQGGITYADLIEPEDAEAVWQGVQAAVGENRTFQLLYRIRTADGTFKWVWDQGSGIFSPEHELQFLEGCIFDITEWVESARFLRLQRDLAIESSGGTDIEQTLRGSMSAILEATGLDTGGIYLEDEDTKTFNLVCSEGASDELLALVSRPDVGSSVARQIREGVPRYAEDAVRHIPNHLIHLDDRIKSFAIVPVKADNEVIGAIVGSSHTHAEISLASRRAMEILAGQIGQAVLRSRLLAELRKSESRYRLLHDNAGEAIFTYDRDGRIISVNRKACEGIGYGEEELLGRNLFEIGLLREVDVESVKASFQSLIEEGRPLKGILRLIGRDGSAIYIDITAAPLKDEDGKVVAVSNIATDITERKRAEEALKASEEELRVTFESTGTAMAILERDGTIARINKEMERLIGYSAGEVEHKKKWMEFIAEESRQQARAYGQRLKQGAAGEGVRGESILIDKNGGRIDAIITASFLPGTSKVVLSALDITQKKKYERLLEERAEQLRDFLDVAAHELRHPATLLKGYAMTLFRRMESMDEETKEDALRAINTGVGRLVAVVEELLDVSRIERGRFHVLREPVEIEPLVERVVREMEGRGCSSPITIESRSRIGMAEVDAESFSRLLVILLDNAVRYSPIGSPVEVVTEGDNGKLVMSVIDRGIGVPEEEREKIFERFYQVESAIHKGTSGLGLGLYVGKQIVEAHGGEIDYRPRQGSGSIFRVTLPR